MRRHLLGVIALGLIIAGVMGWLGSNDSASGVTFAASAIRIGIVLGALWLAWPDVMSWNPWLTAATLLGVAIVVVNVKAVIVVAPVLLAIWLLWNRHGRGGPPQAKKRETKSPTTSPPSA